jgi:hypothetical protein
MPVDPRPLFTAQDLCKRIERALGPLASEAALARAGVEAREAAQALLAFADSIAPVTEVARPKIRAVK